MDFQSAFKSMNSRDDNCGLPPLGSDRFAKTLLLEAVKKKTVNIMKIL